MYKPPKTDLRRMKQQSQDMDLVQFLSGLKFEYKPIHTNQCSSDLPSFHEVYSQLQHSITLIKTSYLVSTLHLSPLVAILVDHEVIVVGEVVVRVVDETQGEATS